MVNLSVDADMRANLACLGGVMKPGSRIRVIRAMMDSSGHAPPVGGMQLKAMAGWMRFEKIRTSKDRS
jgi:hypothetical protein